MKEIYEKELCDKIIGCAIEVHKELGFGFLEKVYENALMVILKEKGINAEQQKNIDVYFHNENVGEYFADILVENKVILELKTVKNITENHQAQLLHYLKATGIKIGYIINFANEKLEFKRMVF
jgi:GxxExxY protein